MDFNVDEGFFRPNKIELLEGFKLIWYKVILRAVYDYVLYKESRNKSLRRLADNAEKWLFFPSLEKVNIIEHGLKKSTLMPPFNSIDNLCLILDLDVGEIRKFAKKISRKDIRKIEFFQRSKYKPRKKKNENI